MTCARTIRRIAGLAAGLIVSLSLSAQTNDAATRLIPANTRCSFKLLQQLVRQSPEKNLLITPTGLSLTFALLDNGADPATREEIESVFGFAGLDLTQMNEGAAALRSALQLARPVADDMKEPAWATPQQWRTMRSAPPNGMIIADSLWLSHMSFPQSFMKVNEEYYGADVKRLLAGSSPSVQISQWATERTRKSLSISPGPMSKNDFLFVDVTYFRSFWKEHFSESETKPGTFTLANGSTKKVPFMYQTHHFEYFEDEKFQAVDLPYSYQASMFVFLPREESSLKEFEQSLNAEHWQQWQSRFESRLGLVGLPRLQMETGLDVRAVLKELGLKRAFETFAAVEPILGRSSA